ncbi:MAG: RNA polymerase sigma factor [Planctomycetota bacterium]|nr:RNA polymerase sigma factor [Planctomycetota bacterium]
MSGLSGLPGFQEQELIRQACSGCRTSAQTLVQTHQRSLYSYLLRMTGRHDIAEDVVQEAFVRAFRNLHRFDFKYRFSTWLFTIARNVYLNMAAKHTPTNVPDVPEMPVAGWGDETALERRERRDVVNEALQRAMLGLSTIQREIVIRFHQESWPIWLIAEELGLPEGTVKSHLHRAREQLAASLLENESVAAKLKSVEAMPNSTAKSATPRPTKPVTAGAGTPLASTIREVATIRVREVRGAQSPTSVGGGVGPLHGLREVLS